MTPLRKLAVVLFTLALASSFAAAAQAQDLAITRVDCEPSGRIAFSITNQGAFPSGTFSIRIEDATGRDISNFGLQNSLRRGETINAVLELIRADRQEFRIIADPENRVFDRNRSNNFADLICSSSGQTGPIGPPGSGGPGGDCRTVDVLGFPVTICEPGPDAPPSSRPPRNVGFDLAIQLPRCGAQQVRFEIGNFGTRRSFPTEVALIDAATNAVVRTWNVPGLVLGQTVELSGPRPRDGDYVLTILHQGDANPSNDTVNLLCERRGPITPPPTGPGFGGDTALVNRSCNATRLRFDVENEGFRRTDAVTVILIDETDRVVMEWDIPSLAPRESRRLRFFNPRRNSLYRAAMFDADDDNLGNNFIVIEC